MVKSKILAILAMGMMFCGAIATLGAVSAEDAAPVALQPSAIDNTIWLHWYNDGTDSVIYMNAAKNDTYANLAGAGYSFTLVPIFPLKDTVTMNPVLSTLLELDTSKEVIVTLFISCSGNLGIPYTPFAVPLFFIQKVAADVSLRYGDTTIGSGSGTSEMIMPDSVVKLEIKFKPEIAKIELVEEQNLFFDMMFRMSPMENIPDNEYFQGPGYMTLIETEGETHSNIVLPIISPTGKSESDQESNSDSGNGVPNGNASQQPENPANNNPASPDNSENNNLPETNNLDNTKSAMETKKTPGFEVAGLIGVVCAAAIILRRRR